MLTELGAFLCQELEGEKPEVLGGQLAFLLDSFSVGALKDLNLKRLLESVPLTAEKRQELLAQSEQLPLFETPGALVEESEWGFLALQACAADDVGFVYHALSTQKMFMEFKVSQVPREFPFLLQGDSLKSVAQRFNSFWCNKLLVFWRVKNMVGEGGTKGGEKKPELDAADKRRSRVIKSSRPNRRGSYAIMKRDLQERATSPASQLPVAAAKSEDDGIIVIVRLDHVRAMYPNMTLEAVVPITTSPVKKARHLVYEIGERFGIDLEAWALRRSGGSEAFLEDYKSLAANQVAHGDEVFVVLKHKLLQDQKNFSCSIRLFEADGSNLSFSLAVDPFVEVGKVLQVIKARLPRVTTGYLFFLPLVDGVGESLGGVVLDPKNTFASYGMMEAEWIVGADSMGPTRVKKPLLLGPFQTVLKYPIVGISESDPRLSVWLDILSKYADCYRQTVGNNAKRARKQYVERIDAALAEGIPPSLRGKVWEMLLDTKTMQMQHGYLYEQLSEQDLMSEDEEQVLERIERDLDRTMPYHPYFRVKGGPGQKHLLDVLRAFALHDRGVQYCQGLNFIVATLLTVMDAASAFWALTRLMTLTQFGLRDNFVAGMPGTHAMLAKFESVFQRLMPDLHAFMMENGLIAASFATEWFLTLFSASAADPALIWDVFLWYGTPSLYAIALAMLQVKEDEMMGNPEAAMDTLKQAWQNTPLPPVLRLALKQLPKVRQLL